MKPTVSFGLQVLRYTDHYQLASCTLRSWHQTTPKVWMPCGICPETCFSWNVCFTDVWDKNAQPYQHLKLSNSHKSWEKIWKIPNHKRDMAKRWCIPQMANCNLPSGQKVARNFPLPGQCHCGHRVPGEKTGNQTGVRPSVPDKVEFLPLSPCLPSTKAGHLEGWLMWEWIALTMAI